MRPIKILDDHIANQIAAGEVVERPSSVVKELVENSIDAGSSKIDVSIADGGISMIRVTDNGHGIPVQECEVAFSRHATSKIKSNRDLFHIQTLGFRGEALPSIAAVSRLECVSSTRRDGLGRRIAIEGGKIIENSEAAASQGTDIIVRELFYNTPARLKYLKTVQTELNRVSDFMYRLALAHPEISFTLQHNDHDLLQTTGSGDLRQVIAAVYGTSIGKSMIEVRAENLDAELSGFIAKPEITRANRYSMSVIVNGRYVRSYALLSAIVEAYHTLLPVHRYPIAVLHLKLEPSLIDVNVHPAKLEIRFSKEKELTAWIQEELKQQLRKQNLIPDAAKPPARKTESGVIQEQMNLYRPSNSSASGSVDFPVASRTGETAASHPPHNISASAAQDTDSADPVRTEWTGRSEAERDDGSAEPASEAFGRPDGIQDQVNVNAPYRSPAAGTAGRSASHPPAGLTRRSFTERRGSGNSFSVDMLGRSAAAGPDSDSSGPTVPDFPLLYPIGQMHGTYIIAQNEEGLFLIDQHAAHERIHYERFYREFGRPQEASQELLVPITLEYTPAEAEVLQQKLALFEQVGVHLEYFGGSTFLVRAHPHWFPEGESQEIIDDMAQWILSEKGQIDIAKLREKSSILCSCKASIKANQNLGHSEIEILLDELRSCGNPYTCPHGRPIVISFSNYDLEKLFKRVM